MSITVCASMRQVPPGYFMADCAVSGGTLDAYLREALRAASGKLCVRLCPVYMDFPMPCPSGTGKTLSAEELKRLHGDAPCYFSEPLCTEYFTCLRGTQAHTVLYDSMQSLRKKFHLLECVGVPAVLIEDAALRRAITG